MWRPEEKLWAYVCVRQKNGPKVIGSGSKKTVSDETTEMIAGVPSRRIGAPANALVVWALRVEDLIPQECRPGFSMGFQTWGAEDFRSCAVFPIVSADVAASSPASRPKASGDGTSAHLGGRGAVKVVAGEPTLSAYHIAPTPAPGCPRLK
jgi:hypothetical protein